MVLNNLASIPFLGVGVPFKDHFLGKLARNLHHIDCFEVKPEHYFKDIKGLVQELHIIAEQRPIIAHGLCLSIATASGVRKRHINKLNNFFKHSPDILFLSEHLGLCSAGGISIPHFVNIPYTSNMLEVLVRNIDQVQQLLAVPVIYENIPAEFLYPESEMSEAEFLKQLTTRTGCGLLFDATNLYANAYNFGWDIDAYLDVYPIDHIIQVHFNGGKIVKGLYVDSHSEVTPEPIWHILQTVIQRGAPVRAMILERDDDGADLDVLVDELSRAKSLLTTYSHYYQSHTNTSHARG